MIRIKDKDMKNLCFRPALVVDGVQLEVGVTSCRFAPTIFPITIGMHDAQCQHLFNPWPAPTACSANRYPVPKQAHCPGLLPRRLHVPAREPARVVLDDELVGHGLQADEMVVLADDDLAAAVKLRTDLRQDGLLVLLEGEGAFDGGVR